MQMGDGAVPERDSRSGAQDRLAQGLYNAWAEGDFRAPHWILLTEVEKDRWRRVAVKCSPGTNTN